MTHEVHAVVYSRIEVIEFYTYRHDALTAPRNVTASGANCGRGCEANFRYRLCVHDNCSIAVAERQSEGVTTLRGGCVSLTDV